MLYFPWSILLTERTFIMYISDDIFYIGVNDHRIDLFEGQYPVPHGMSYNSYVIMDEKIAVMDTVDAGFTEEWLLKLSSVLSGRKPDYLVIQHMEPDHSAGIAIFMEAYPDTCVVSSAPAFTMMNQFFGSDFNTNRMVIKEGDTLGLGRHELTFVAAPMVHWPEVMVTYDACDQILFSADGFGKFGALDEEEAWTDGARRYYFGIVGRFGMQVQNLLKKASGLTIQKICPLHGPVLSENLACYLSLYNTWSSYQPEEKGITIAYASVYGNTRKAAELLADILEKKGCKNVVLMDLARTDLSFCLENAFRYDKLVLASITYNAGIFPYMDNFLRLLKEHNYQNRTIAFIENGCWAPTAAKGMMEVLKDCKNLTFVENTVTIRSAVNEDTMKKIEALAEELAE